VDDYRALIPGLVFGEMTISSGIVLGEMTILMWMMPGTILSGTMLQGQGESLVPPYTRGSVSHSISLSCTVLREMSR